MRKSVILAASLLGFLAACKHRSAGDSATKYGHHSEMVKSASLLWQQPGDKIAVCGHHAKEVAQGVTTWLSAISRDKDLKISAHENCDEVGEPNALIRVKDFSLPGGPDVPLRCDGSLSGYVVQPNVLRKIKFGGDIGFCYTPLPTTNMVLHEVGHLIGLCDQYTEANKTVATGIHANCDPTFSSKEAQSSVMNFTNSINTLQPDDILGVRVLACRQAFVERPWFMPFGGMDKRINEIWQKKIGPKIETWDLNQLGTEMDRINREAGSQQFLDGCVGAVQKSRQASK